MTNQGFEPEDTAASNRRRAAFSGIEQRLLKHVRSLDLGERPRVVVGFSGGPDSLCLAAILARLARNGHASPLLVHVEHHLRPNAELEAKRVDELAQAIDLPLVRRSLRSRFVDDHPGVGIEEAARRERYLELAREADAFETSVIAVGHHQSDQVETVLLHLLRGSGLRGVSGMKAATAFNIPWWKSEASPGQYTLWRPLLLEPKSLIDRLVADLGVQPIIDESNVDQRYRRNAVRHSVLPAIDNHFPDARAAIARFASVAADEDAYLRDVALIALERALTDEGALPRAALLQEAIPIRRRMIVTWFQTWISSDAISFDRVEAVIELTESNRGGAVIEVGEGFGVVMMKGTLVLCPANSKG